MLQKIFVGCMGPSSSEVKGHFAVSLKSTKPVHLLWFSVLGERGNKDLQSHSKATVSKYETWKAFIPLKYEVKTLQLKPSETIVTVVKTSLI